MKKSEASWSAELWAKCPYCEDYQQIEYEKIDEWWCDFPLCESKDNINYTHKCEECGKEFIVDSAVY